MKKRNLALFQDDPFEKLPGSEIPYSEAEECRIFAVKAEKTW